MTRFFLAGVILAALENGATRGQPAPGADIVRLFVSPAGNDAWSGRSPDRQGDDGPFLTVERAVETARRLRAQGYVGRIVISLRSGTFFLRQPIRFGPDFFARAEAPLVLESYGKETATISGGVPISGWRRGDDGVWRAPAPTGPGGKVIEFRQLFVDGRREIRARTPNFDPGHPYTRGWFFVDAAQQPEPVRPGFGVTLVRIHTPGDTFTWRFEAPADGKYAVWVRYGAFNKPFGRTRMDGRTTIQIDQGAPIPLENLPDTGGWNRFAWRKTAEVTLRKGSHLLRWTNVRGGGLNLDAFLLTDDPGFQPPAPRKGRVALPGNGRHAIVIQAENYASAKAREFGVSAGARRRPKWARDRFRYRPGDIRPWPQSPDPEIHIFPAWGWVNAILSVQRIDEKTRTVFVRNRNCTQDLRPGNRYFVENVREALDAPGEWYLDKRAREILYIPRDAAFRGKEVTAPVLFSLIEIEGNKSRPETDSEQEAETPRIVIRNLTFRHTRYSLEMPSVYSPDDAAICLENARNCAVEHCRFIGIGGYAVRLRDSSSHCRISGNEIVDGGQGGVFLEGKSTANQPHDNEICGNRIRRCGRIWKHVAGVYVSTGSRNHIAWNTIEEMPRYGVSLKSFGPGAASHHNVVEYNRIVRTNLETNDTGAVETLGRDRRPSGNVIRFNLILDVVGIKTTPDGRILTPFYTWGVYLDDYSSGTLVYGNIVARTYRGGVHIHLGRENVIENNIFVDGREQQIECNGGASMRANRVLRNIVVSRSGRMIRVNPWSPRVFAECNHNLYWRPDGTLIADAHAFPTGDFASWRKAGMDADSLIANPGFRNPENDDYRLPPDSPAFRLGFVRIPVEKIGADAWKQPGG